MPKTKPARPRPLAAALAAPPAPRMPDDFQMTMEIAHCALRDDRDPADNAAIIRCRNKAIRRGYFTAPKKPADASPTENPERRDV